jgi:hypothetical protein
MSGSDKGNGCGLVLEVCSGWGGIVLVVLDEGYFGQGSLHSTVLVSMMRAIILNLVDVKVYPKE